MLRREFLKSVLSVVFGPFIPLDFFRRRTLHMWINNDAELVIAETAEEAHQMIVNFYGDEPLLFDECEWEKVNPDAHFTIIDCLDSGGGSITKKTIREYIHEKGKGLFACMEF